MSFDLFYQPCRFETEPVGRRNPFTGEIRAGLPVEPVSDEEVRAIQSVLAGAGARGPDEFGCSVIELGDGGEAEVYGDDPSEGLMVAVHRGLTPGLLQFLYDLLGAAEWVLLPAMEGNPAIVTSPGLAGGLPETFPEVVCGSPEALGTILSGGFDAWKRYRDRIVGEGQ